MVTKRRDYAAEYKRRISKAREKGYSMAIARGHPPTGVVGIALSKKIRVPVGTEIADLRVETVPVPGDDPKAIRVALKDEGFTLAEIREIDVTDQETFVKTLLAFGYSYREAFDLFFGY